MPFDPTASPAENLRNIFDESPRPQPMRASQARAIEEDIRDAFNEASALLLHQIPGGIAQLSQGKVLTEQEAARLKNTSYAFSKALGKYEETLPILDEAIRRYGLEQMPEHLQPFLFRRLHGRGLPGQSR